MKLNIIIYLFFLIISSACLADDSQFVYHNNCHLLINSKKIEADYKKTIQKELKEKNYTILKLRPSDDPYLELKINDSSVIINVENFRVKYMLWQNSLYFQSEGDKYRSVVIDSLKELPKCKKLVPGNTIAYHG